MDWEYQEVVTSREITPDKIETFQLSDYSSWFLPDTQADVCYGMYIMVVRNQYILIY